MPARLAALSGGAALAASVPFLFFFIEFQPKVTARGVSVAISDVAVLLLAALAATRWDTARLRAGLPLWIAAGIFLADTFLACLYPRAWDDSYAVGTNFVTAGKFAEYALLAPSVVLLVRRRRDLDVFLAAIVVWGVLATMVAVAQFLGADIFANWPRGERQPSFLGIDEFAAYSASTLLLGLAALVWPPERRVERRFAWVAGASGLLGLVLSGTMAGGIGAGLAAVALAFVGWRRGALDARRLAAGAAVMAVAAVGLLALRAGDVGAFTRFVGLRPETHDTRTNVQTYAHRTLMAYFGLRMWRDRPVLGVGWQAVKEPANFERYTADAHRRFPDLPPLAFPTRAHPWRIDDAFVQALAELGVVGFAAFVGFLATAVVLALRAALRAPPAGLAVALVGLAWLLVGIGIWTGQGLVAGTSYDAMTWLAVGFVAAARVYRGAP